MMKYLEMTKTRLKMFKYEATNDDISTLEYLSQSTLNSINNFCNQNYTEDSLPNQLTNVYVDKIVGEFLENKKLSGELENFDFSLTVKKISEGDTSVEYNPGTNFETEFSTLISNLKNGKSNELIRFRRLPR